MSDKEYTKTQIVIPHKALPQEPGRVYRFAHPTDASEGTSHPSDVEDFRRIAMEVYLDFIAHELSNTDIATQEAGYPSVPSVIVFTQNTYRNKVLGRDASLGFSFSLLRDSLGTNNYKLLQEVYGEKRVPLSSFEIAAKEKKRIERQKQSSSSASMKGTRGAKLSPEVRAGFEKLQDELEQQLKEIHLKERAYKEKMWQAAGAYAPESTHRKLDYYDSDESYYDVYTGTSARSRRRYGLAKEFSERDFLANISVDSGTGVHYFVDMPESDDGQIRLHLETARKYFDIVLISPENRASMPADLVDSYYGDADSFKERVSTSTGVTMVENLAALQGRLWEDKDSDQDKQQIYIIRPEKAVYGGNNDNAAPLPDTLLRLIAMDFIRDMLGVSRSSTLEVKEKGTWLARASIHSSTTEQDSLLWDHPGRMTLVAMLSGSMTATGMLTGTPLLNLLSLLPSAVLISSLTNGVWGSILRHRFNKKGKQWSNEMGTHLEKTVRLYDRYSIAESEMGRAYQHGALTTPQKIDSLPIAERPAVTTGASHAQVQSPTGQSLSLDLLLSRAQELQERWMEYELDPMKALDYPLMLDLSCKETIAFISAMREMRSYQEQAEKSPKNASHLASFRKALVTAEDAFAVAENKAHKTRLSGFTPDEKKRVKRAKELAAIAKDENASPNERKVAFERANQELEGIMVPLNPKIIGLLEA